MRPAARTTTAAQSATEALRQEAGRDWEPRWTLARDATGVAYFRHADVPFFIVHIGSSSSVYDRRCVFQPNGSVATRQAAVPKQTALSVVEQLAELMAALALNKSLLAKVLRVSRPTIYEWFADKQPKRENEERLQSILTLMARASVSASSPLNARFVRRPSSVGEPSVVDLLCEDRIDSPRAIAAMGEARILTERDRRQRRDREGRLRDLGLGEPSPNRRRETLARNVGLLEWPKE